MRRTRINSNRQLTILQLTMSGCISKRRGHLSLTLDSKKKPQKFLGELAVLCLGLKSLEGLLSITTGLSPWQLTTCRKWALAQRIDAVHAQILFLNAG